MEKEVRSLGQAQSELRAISGSRKIEGIAIVFNKLSRDLGGFRERIIPEAVEGVLESSDVLCTLNHLLERGVLARSKYGKGTLNLQTDNKGVRYSFVAPNTSLGDEVVEGIRRGDIRASSFSFNIVAGGEEWETRNGESIRTITKFSNIWDVSPVYREAYESTTVALRSLSEFQKSEESFAEKTKYLTPYQRSLYYETMMYGAGYTKNYHGRWVKTDK